MRAPGAEARPLILTARWRPGEPDGRVATGAGTRACMNPVAIGVQMHGPQRPPGPTKP